MRMKKKAPLTVQLVKEQTPRDTGISACTYGAGIFDTVPTFLKRKSQLCFRNCPSLGGLFVSFLHSILHMESSLRWRGAVFCYASAVYGVKHNNTAGRVLPCDVSPALVPRAGFWYKSAAVSANELKTDKMLNTMAHQLIKLLSDILQRFFWWNFVHCSVSLKKRMLGLGISYLGEKEQKSFVSREVIFEFIEIIWFFNSYPVRLTFKSWTDFEGWLDRRLEHELLGTIL